MIDINYEVEIDERDLEKFLTSPTNKTKINAAISRSLKKVTRWVAIQTARGLSKGLDVAVKGLKDRIYFSLDKTKDGKASIWVGLNDLHAASIGKMRQTKAGIRVRGHSFRGAFIGTPFNSGNEMGWRRASSAHQSSHDEVRNNATQANQQRPKEHPKWPRYPLNKVGLHIEYESTEFLQDQERLLGQQFNKILQQELNYEFNVKTQ